MRGHVRPRGELDAIATESFDVVKTLDAFGRIRFANDGGRLSEWEPASSVEANSRPAKAVAPEKAA